MTFGGGEMTGGEMTMGRNDRNSRIPCHATTLENNSLTSRYAVKIID